MIMKEGETFAQYCGQIKVVLNVIKGDRGIIFDETVISKVFKNLLPLYAIRVSTI